MNPSLSPLVPAQPVRIAGLGSYLPARRVTSQEMEERFELPPGWIERRTGVRERCYNTGKLFRSWPLLLSSGPSPMLRWTSATWTLLLGAVALTY
jgi:hypothetical protein